MIQSDVNVTPAPETPDCASCDEVPVQTQGDLCERCTAYWNGSTVRRTWIPGRPRTEQGEDLE